jgi:hypothetical protein
VERLEDRQLMAGDVVASLLDGNLVLTEARGQSGADNSVRVSQLSSGMIRVSGNGTLAGGSQSLINGQEFQDFLVPGDLTVNFGGGQDLLVFDSSAGDVPRLGNVSLNMGVTSATGDTDDDNVMIFGLETRGSLNVKTGAGADWIFVGDARIGDGVATDNLMINSGAGSDLVQLKFGTHVRGNASLVTYSSTTEQDADEVLIEMDVVVDKNVNVRLGGGNDRFIVRKPDEIFFPGLPGLTTGGSVNVNSGAGADYISIAAAKVGDDVGVDNLWINSGAGSDTIQVTDMIGRVADGIYVTTFASLNETDADLVHFEHAFAGQDIVIRTGAGNDVVNLIDVVAYDDFTLEAGAGDDIAYFDRFIAVDNLFADMDDGFDGLSLLKTSAKSATLLGGADGDSLIMPTTFKYEDLALDGWERINGRRTIFDDIFYDIANDGVLTR